VSGFLQEAFISRDSKVPLSVVEDAARKLNISQDEADKMFSSLSQLVRIAVYNGYSEPEQMQQLFPDSFHGNLKDLLTSMLCEKSSAWKNTALSKQVSMPKLVDFSWRVDVKTASNESARMSVPACILQVQVEDKSHGLGVDSHTVELNKETLDTMLDGLSKIRDQLNNVANR